DGAVQRLQAWGYKVTVSPHAYGECGRFSGTDEERLADIQAALQDPSVDFILCSRGGYGLQRIIDKINLSSLNVNRSTLIGFSDITALHQLFTLHSPISTLHGLMCKHIATLPDDSTALQLFRRALARVPITYTLPDHPLNRLGTTQATLVGGNLSVLYGLQGTPYDLNHVIDAHPEGVLLFIEDICERHYHIDRMMNNLRMSGVLSRIKGLVVGQFTDCESDPLMNCTIYDTIAQNVAAYDYPVLFDFPAGHVEDNRPLYLNHSATLTITEDAAQLLQP
ncbi:MAG: LD-carboxypeptidase, partial [Paludibacteraceae bacterium]|nr:LD-carboxypeptidase [Paludibacteraceae bacterium]